MDTTTNHHNNLFIRDFQPADQTAARQLILTGLAGHWGVLDPTLNPDLNDIATSYANGVFLVAYRVETLHATSLQATFLLVGTGALIPEGTNRGRIVRMSVDPSLRRKGIGRRLLDALVERGRKLSYREILLETTATWQDAVSFYQQYGFETTGFANGDRHFRLSL
jgi:ribosomal protein S18 acetylase RimI-like enzyme